MNRDLCQRRQTFREDVQGIMHYGCGRLGHTFNFVLIILILLSVAIVPVGYFPNFKKYEIFITTFEAIIVGIFTMEYLFRIYAAPHRLRYIFSFYGLIDLIAILPFYTSLFHTEWVRILRFLRFLKLGEMRAAAGAEEEEVMQHDIGLASSEHVEYVVTKHPLFLIIGCVPSAIAISVSLAILILSEGNPIGIGISVALLFFALVFIWKTWLDFSYDVIYLTTNRFIFNNQHLLGRSTNQMSYNAITNVKPSYPSIFSFIFRYGTITIDTAAEHPGQVSMAMVRHHEKAAHMIMQKAAEAQKKS